MVGKLFAPIMLTRFDSAGLGLRSIIANPEVLHALNPMWAVHFFLEYKTVSFIALGAVVLSITGSRRCMLIWGTLVSSLFVWRGSPSYCLP